MLKKMMYVGLGLFLFCLVSTQGHAELISEWKFDGDARDSVGNNHGRYRGTNAPGWVADRLGNQGKALSLDGVDEYVDCGNDKSLRITDAITIEAWVNPAPGGIIIDKRMPNFSHMLYTLTAGGGGVSFTYCNQANKVQVFRSPSDSILADVWQHIVFTFTYGTGSSAKIYINGVLQKKSHWSGGNGSDVPTTQSFGYQVLIGRASPGTGHNYFKGSIDEVRIYNHALSPEEVKTLYNAQRMISGKKIIKDLEGTLAKLEIEKRVRLIPAFYSSGKSWKQLVNTELSTFKRKIKSVKDRSFLIPASEIAEIKKIGSSVPRLNVILSALERGKIKNEDYLSYVVPPISAVKILPTSIPGEISDEVRIIAAPGEYEPASFVITALSDIKSLQVKATNLIKKKNAHSQDQGIIPASAIDIKLVKCWYQAGSAWYGVGQNKSGKVLVPELLLNDDSLVKVDYEKKGNYLKLNFPEGEKYVWISDPSWPSKAKSIIPSIKEFPVKDSPVLLPVNIPAGRNQQFWITVKVPEDAKPGIYTGKINLSTQKRPLGALTLKLRVLPFKLAAPYYTFSIDYHGIFDPENPERGTISSRGKTRKQFKKELENMVAHGLSNCQHYSIGKKILGEVLKVRKEAGMDNKTLYLKSAIAIGNPTCPEKLEAIKKNVRAVLEIVKPFGTEVVYFYGMCEVVGEKLKSQRPAWKAVREAGGRIFVAGGTDNIKMMGDIQDMHVRSGWPSKEEAGKWHSYGHKIFCYNNPQAGVENPVVYRRNFGLLLWKHNYDGAATNAYQHTFGVTWNDFDHPIYRAHTIAYPTVDGVIDTIAWEGYREAADDVRYATTLQRAIEKARKSKDQKLKPIAASAEDCLRRLKTGTDIETGDLDTIRLEIIGYILTLQEKMK